jgi:hypothetical protein
MSWAIFRSKVERLSAAVQKLLNGHVYVLGDLPKQGRRDVSAGVERDCRASPVRVAVLAMRAALPNLFKAETFQQGGNFTRFQNRQRCHAYATRIV